MYKLLIGKIGILIVLLIYSFCAFNQTSVKKIEIVNSDSLTFDKSRGSDVKLLYGHVVFRQDNVLMYCDSAHFYSENNLFDAYSNIHIVQGDTVEAWADSLKYNGNQKLAQMRGNVKMRDRKTILTTRYFDYETNSGIGKYYEGGKIIDEENTLTSQIGVYYSAKKELFFKTAVVLHNKAYDILTDTLKYNTNTNIAYFLGSTNVLKDESRLFTKKGWYNTKTDICVLLKDSWFRDKEKYLKGDSIFYNKKKGFATLFKNIVINDTSQHLTIKGNYAYYKEKPEYFSVTDNMILEKIFDDDTLHLHADTLVGFKNDTINDNRIIKTFHKVRFFKPDIQGKCDSMVYLTKDSVMTLFGKPVMWSDKNQISGKDIKILFKNDEVKSVTVDEMAFVISQEKDTVEFNQIKGSKFTAHFVKGQFSRLDIKKNGETIYYMKDDNKLTGINKAICENLTVYYKNNEIHEVVFRKKPIGTLYPPDQIKYDETFLSNFDWNIKIRPKNKNDILIWKE